jgi:DNA primase
VNGDNRVVRTAVIREAMKGHEIQVLNALGINWNGGAPHTRCPYPDHDDINPSWRWDEPNRRARCTCCKSASIFDVISKVKGIDFEAAKVLAAELIGRSDLILGKRGKSTIAATYNYTDEAGEMLFQVVRYKPKRFLQRRLDVKKGWIWKLDHVRIVPYRLPAVIAAVAAGQTIYIPEGEKHVDRLIDLGLAATCNPMGAGKWRDDFAVYFRGASVVILPDNDKPGLDHAHDVAANLSCIAARLCVLALPGLDHKGDVINWLDAGGTATEFDSRRNAPRRENVLG